jgi:hypothetical protein
MIPTISTAAADSTHIHAPSAMFEVGGGMTKQILSGLWEDIAGAKQVHVRA